MLFLLSIRRRPVWTTLSCTMPRLKSDTLDFAFSCGIYRISGLCQAYILDVFFDSIALSFTLFSCHKTGTTFEPALSHAGRGIAPIFRSGIFLSILPALQTTAPATPPEMPPALTALQYGVPRPGPVAFQNRYGLRKILGRSFYCFKRTCSLSHGSYRMQHTICKNTMKNG